MSRMDRLSPHATHECGCDGRLDFEADAAYAVPECKISYILLVVDIYAQCIYLCFK